jgi:hypothetical protein
VEKTQDRWEPFQNLTSNLKFDMEILPSSPLRRYATCSPSSSPSVEHGHERQEENHAEDKDDEGVEAFALTFRDVLAPGDPPVDEEATFLRWGEVMEANLSQQ